MAKGSPFTTFTGKLGQIVGYIIKNAASKQSQGMRAYQPNVANPKTVLQANQRLCLKPLNNMYRALSSVVDRGFENLKYGTESRREFMRINMTSFAGPYVRKGENLAVPGPVVISQGSLVPVGIIRLRDGSQNANFGGFQSAVSDIYCTDFATVGSMSRDIIARNTDIQDGDQLTFVAVYAYADAFVYKVSSFTLDSTSTVATGYVQPSTGVEGSFGTVGDVKVALSAESGVGYLQFSLDTDPQGVLAACAVIQSREGEKGEHMRSDTTLFVSPGTYDVWFSQEQYEAALASYMGDAAVIDWPVQQTAESAVILQESVSVHVPATDLVGQSAENFPNGVDVMGFVMSDGTIGVWVDGENELLDMMGRRISYVVTEQTFYVTLASTSTIPTRIYFGGVVPE